MSHIRTLFRYLTPMCILPSISTVGFTYLSAFVTPFGAETIAAFSIMRQVLNLLSGVLVWWMLIGLILAAIQAEQGRLSRARLLHGVTVALFGVLVVGTALVLRLFPEPLVKIFSHVESINAQTVAMLSQCGLAAGGVALVAVLIGQLFRRYHPIALILLVAVLIIAATVSPILLRLFVTFDPARLGLCLGVLFALGHMVPFALIPWRSFVKSFASAES